MKKIIDVLKSRGCNLSVKTKILLSMLGVTFTGLLIIGIYFYVMTFKWIVFYSNNFIENTMHQETEIINQKAEVINNFMNDFAVSEEIQDGLLYLNNINRSEYEIIQQTVEMRKSIMRNIINLEEIISIYVYPINTKSFVVGQTQYPIPVINENIIASHGGENMWINIEQDEDFIHVEKAVYSLKNMNLLGYIVVKLEKEYFTNNLYNLEFASENIFIISDYEKNVVMSNTDNGEKLQLNLPESNSEKVYEYKIDGVTKQICVNYIPQTKWKLISIINDVRKNETVTYLLYFSSAILFSVFILMAIAAVFIAKGITKPIINLSKAMTQFSKGDFSISTNKKYHNEIGQARESFDRMVVAMDQLVHNYETEQMLKKEAQIHKLQMQMNPHFIYNTLDSINWLALENRVNDVSDITHSLGLLLRFSLNDKIWITMEEELEAVETYLNIQKYRYGKNLNIGIDVSEQVLYEQVPRHTILPLVENSIEHGMKDKKNNMQIQVSITMNNTDINIVVQDNGKGMSKLELEKLNMWVQFGYDRGIKERTKGHLAIGLKNIHSRLQLYYGSEYGVLIESTEKIGTKVTIKLATEDSCLYKIKERDNKKDDAWN